MKCKVVDIAQKSYYIIDTFSYKHKAYIYISDRKSGNVNFLQKGEMDELYPIRDKVLLSMLFIHESRRILNGENALFCSYMID